MISNEENKSYLGGVEVKIADPHTFRSLVDYLKITSINGNFIFSEKGISFKKAKASRALMNIVYIDPEELLDYIYDGEPNSAIYAGIAMKGFKDFLKNSSKKEGITMTINRDEPKIYITADNTNRTSANHFPLQSIEEEVLVNSIDDIKKLTPICRVRTSEFTTTCSGMISVKSAYVELVCYPRGLEIKGMKSNDTVAKLDAYGICTPIITNDDSPVYVVEDEVSIPVRVDINDIKGLIKLNSLQSNSILKIYSVRPGTICILTGIGSYGKLAIYLQNAVKMTK